MANKNATKKGNTVELSTFLRYDNCKLFGYKTLEKEGKTFVNQVWCKLCAKYKDRLTSNTSTLKGKAKTSALAFIDGTTSVTKFQVSSLILNISSTKNHEQHLK